MEGFHHNIPCKLRHVFGFGQLGRRQNPGKSNKSGNMAQPIIRYR